MSTWIAELADQWEQLAETAIAEAADDDLVKLVEADTMQTCADELRSHLAVHRQEQP